MSLHDYQEMATITVEYKIAVMCFVNMWIYSRQSFPDKHFRRHLIFETDEFFYLKFKKKYFKDIKL